jgi:hypothetical protein
MHHWPEKSADHAWCGAEMAPSITHIIAGSKPSASTSSPHHGRSSLRLVWAWDIVCLRRTVSYDTAKSVRFIYTTIYTASAIISPPCAPFSAPNIVVRCPSPEQSSSSISYALFDCCVLFCCSLAPRTLVVDARAVHRRAPPLPPPAIFPITSSGDCCVARLPPLSSPSTASASSRHDLVAPSPVDCRVAPSSVVALSCSSLPPAIFPVTPHLPCSTHHCLSRPPVPSSSVGCCIAWELFLMSFGFSFSPINLVERILPGVVGVDGSDVGTATAQ